MEPTAHLAQAALPHSAEALLAHIDATIARAQAAAALKTIHTDQHIISEAGIAFAVKWVSSLRDKSRAHNAASHAALQLHSQACKQPERNPFLPPEAALTLGRIGEQHLCVLNKFPVLARHLLLVTEHFEDQTAPLTPADFAAGLALLQPLGGLVFYNGGKIAGASQRHKHLQWIPDSLPSQNFEHLCTALAPSPTQSGCAFHPRLPFRHVFVALPAQLNRQAVYEAWARACAQMDLPLATQPVPPYNVLFNRQWLLLVPRSREAFGDISVNALGFAASLFVRSSEQVAHIRSLGPLHILQAVAYPHSEA